MGQRQIKTARKAAEKTAKAMALELAKAQLMEIANAAFKIRWQFCKAILFPKKLKVSADEKAKIQNIAHGGMNKELKQEQAVNPDKSSFKFGIVSNGLVPMEESRCR